MGLVTEWEAVARSKFRCAEKEQHEFQRRFIEHGAICYANCAFQLRHLIEAGDSSLDLELQIVKKDSKSP
jgi:hypothetical protein